jgi:hypothetical protein
MVVILDREDSSRSRENSIRGAEECAQGVVRCVSPVGWFLMLLALYA